MQSWWESGNLALVQFSRSVMSAQMSMGKTLPSLCLPQSVKLGADTGGPGTQEAGEEFQLGG